jgi:hypothetical protein
VPRRIAALLALALALAASLVPAAGAEPTTANRTSADTASPFVLRGRQQAAGPWQRYLWLKHTKFNIIRFSVCGAWNQAMSPTCAVAQGNALPQGSMLKLEQKVGAGWRTVGVSLEPTLQAVLSNTVARNRYGTVAYRVTLRSETNRVVRASNIFKVFWSR